MKEKKLVNCKRCDAKNLYWNQDWNGKWRLVNEFGSPHACEDGNIKAVKCKYCKAVHHHGLYNFRHLRVALFICDIK